MQITNTDNIQRVVSWGTTKTAEGFAWNCHSFDYQIANIIHAQGVETSRAIAKARATAAYRTVRSLQK